MTEKELFQEILKRMSADKELSAILKKMKAGTADFEDMQRYSLRTAEIKAEVLKENLSPAGTGQNEEACIQILKGQHEDVFQKESSVQKALDEKQNIHISPKKPKFPAERVRKAAHSLEDKTVSEEVIQRRAENAVANIANSFHDDYIKENAEFRQNAGLKCHVSRIGASKCCAWCAEVAGRYEVGKEPADFWRRHDNCSCRMDYENQKVRQRLSGKGRAWKVNSEFQRKQVQRIEYKPTRFTKEQAKALESQKLSQYRGLKYTMNYMSNSFRPDYSKHSETFYYGSISIPVKKVENSSFNLFTDSDNRRNKAVRIVEKSLRNIQVFIPEEFEMPPVAVVDFDKYKLNRDKYGKRHNVIGGYVPQTGVMYFNSQYDTKEKILEFVNENPERFANKTEIAPFLHELGHKYYEDSVKTLAKKQKIEYNKAKSIIDHRIFDYIRENQMEKEIKSNLSGYAQDEYDKSNYTELIAESFSVKENNELAKILITLIREEFS